MQPQIRRARRSTDLTFLMADSTTSTAEDDDDAVGIHDGIHEAMTSIVICGWDESRWTCYAFVDTEFSGEPVSDDEYEGSDELNEDPIASDRRSPEIDADSPIWDPRKYFLRIVNLRMKKQILEEWRYIVGVVERSVNERVSH
jgi:hypothetical protein